MTDSGTFTVDSLHEHITALLAAAEQRVVDLGTKLDERYAAQLLASATERASAERAVAAAFLSAEKAVAAAFAAVSTASQKADIGLSARLEAMNQFRDQLREQQSKFATFEVTDRRFNQVEAQIDGLEKRLVSLMPRAEGVARADSNAEKIAALTTRLDRMEGRSTGLGAGWGYLVAAVGLVATILGIFGFVISHAN